MRDAHMHTCCILQIYSVFCIPYLEESSAHIWSLDKLDAKMTFGVVLAHNKLVCRRNMPSRSVLTHETSYDAMPLVPARLTKAHITDIAPQHVLTEASRHLTLLTSLIRECMKIDQALRARWRPRRAGQDLVGRAGADHFWGG